MLLVGGGKEPTSTGDFEGLHSSGKGFGTEEERESTPFALEEKTERPSVNLSTNIDCLFVLNHTKRIQPSLKIVLFQYFSPFPFRMQKHWKTWRYTNMTLEGVIMGVGQ